MKGLGFCLLFAATTVIAQSSAGSGYTGYNLALEGDEDSVIYSSDETRTNVSSVPPPDVFLNATVHVTEIDLTVSNLTAQINLDAQVLSLLTFNAGVDLSIDRVSLLIQNVNAKVVLEARLHNLMLMINDTLNSLDLNPILATLGQDVGSIVNSTVGAVGGLASSAASSVSKRSYDLSHNILYSVNDYSGNTHTNRILTQTGSIVDESLDNDGNVHSQRVIGSYAKDMTFNGYNQSAVVNGQTAHELEYVYAPIHGLSIVSAIYVDDGGNVIATQVLSESSAGGSSTVGDL